MATVRSISPGKSPDRLLNRRLTRPPTAVSQRKITLTKTTPISVTTTTTTVKRRKSSRTSSKKQLTAPSAIPVRVNSFTAMSTISTNDDLIDQMASTTIEELPPIRRVSKVSDTPSINVEIPHPHIDSNAIVGQQHHEEPLNDTATSNHLNETSLSSSSQESPAANIEFTLDALDTIRTVGTGKTKQTWKIFLFHSSLSFRNLRASSTRLSS